MAMTVSAVNTGTNGTALSGTTITVTGVTASVGDVLLLCIAGGNNGGTVRTISSITDDASGSTNVYSQRASGVYSPNGFNNDGANCYFYECPITTALSANTITITFGTSNAECAAQVYRLQPGAGERIVFVSAGTATGANRTSHSASAVDVRNGHTIFAMAAIETDDAITGDSDTTNGSWSTIQTRLADNGTDPSTMSSSSQYKTVNADGAQNWACSTITARDSVSNTIIYASVGGVAFPLTPNIPPFQHMLMR